MLGAVSVNERSAGTNTDATNAATAAITNRGTLPITSEHTPKRRGDRESRSLGHSGRVTPPTQGK